MTPQCHLSPYRLTFRASVTTTMPLTTAHRHEDRFSSAPHLLSLPGELRNQRYQHALTKEHALRYIEPTATSKAMFVYPSRSETRESNELKYVYKHLYQDASGSEIKYNTIGFMGDYSSKKGPGQKFLEFLAVSKSTTLCWLRNIDLTINNVLTINNDEEV